MITELKEKAVPYVVGAVIWLASVWVLGLSIAENTVSALESNPTEEQFPFKIESNTRFCEEEIEQELNNIRLWIQNREWFYHLIAGNCTFDEEWVSRAEQNKEWYPWMLTANGDSQAMPELTAKDSHQRFKELCEKYWLDASKIWELENKYNIREWVLLAILIAETSWWLNENSNYVNEWCYNLWNVWNTDSWNRVCFEWKWESIEQVVITLNNRNLWKVLTLWCLSNAWSCVKYSDWGYRYATSNGNRERTIKNVLNAIYSEELWEIEPDKFSIRRDFTSLQ